MGVPTIDPRVMDYSFRMQCVFCGSNEVYWDSNGAERPMKMICTACGTIGDFKSVPYLQETRDALDRR